MGAAGKIMQRALGEKRRIVKVDPGSTVSSKLFRQIKHMHVHIPYRVAFRL